MDEGLDRPMEEDIYWKHFNSVHFCLCLPIDFRDHLVLPLKFSENMITKLPNKVSLIGPSGTMCEVELMKTNTIAFVGDGWKDFVKAYGLEVSSILLFKFKHNVGFEVLIFDSATSCEKECSYFVKKHGPTFCNHPENEKGNKVSSEVYSTEALEEVAEGEDHDSKYMTSKKAKNNVEDLACMEETNHLETPRKRSSHSTEALEEVAAGGDHDSKYMTSKKAKNDVEHLACMEETNHLETPRKHSSHSTEALEEVAEGEDHDSKSMTSKKAKNDVEDLACMEETHHLETPRKCSSPVGVNKGGRRGRGRPKKVRPFQSASNTRAKCAGKDSKGNEIAEKEHLPEIGGGNERSNPHKSNETTGGRRGRGRPREVRPFQSASNTKAKCAGKESYGNEAAKEESSVEIVGSTARRVISQQYRKRTRSHKQLVSVPSGKQFDGDKQNGVEDAEEQNAPETGESTPEIVFSHKFSKRRRSQRSSRELSFEIDPTQRLRLSKGNSSTRRPVADIEKLNALQRAQKEQTKNSFIAVMRPTSVHKKYFLNIPKEWVRKFLPLRNKEVVLRVGEKTSTADFYYRSARECGGLAGPGWKKFARKNFLEESDVCLFTLVSKKQDPAIVFDVGIFRVIPDMIGCS